MHSELPAADVIIVGGGVIGSSTAYWLNQRGLSTTVIERRSTLGSWTTPNALGTIRTQYGTPTLIDLAQESLEFYQNIGEHLGVDSAELGWANQGYLYLTDSEAHIERLRESIDTYAELGVTSSSLVTGGELHDRFPFVGQAVAGIFHADGSWVDPAAITSAWAGATTNTTFVTDTTATAVEQVGQGWRVDTDRGSVEGDAVVLCTGPAAPAMLASKGCTLPHKITPRYRAFIPDDDPHHAAAPLVINIANGAYWRPVPGGVWISHANVDDRHVEPADGVVVPPAFLDECINQIEPVSPQLAETARRTDSGEITYAGGFQVYPGDDAPFIGQVPGAPGLFTNCGHWAGVMLSPAAGRLAADLVTGAVAEAQNSCRLTRFDDGPVERSSTNKFGGWG